MQERTEQNMTDQEMITCMLKNPGSAPYSMQELLKAVESSDNKEQYRGIGVGIRLAAADLEGLITEGSKLQKGIKKIFGETNTSNIIAAISRERKDFFDKRAGEFFKGAIKTAIPTLAKKAGDAFQKANAGKNLPVPNFKEEINATFELIELLCVYTNDKSIEELKKEEKTHLIAGLLHKQPEEAPARSAGAAEEDATPAAEAPAAEEPAPERPAAEEPNAAIAAAAAPAAATQTPTKLEQLEKKLAYIEKSMTEIAENKVQTQANKVRFEEIIDECRKNGEEGWFSDSEKLTSAKLCHKAAIAEAEDFNSLLVKYGKQADRIKIEIESEKEDIAAKETAAITIQKTARGRKDRKLANKLQAATTEPAAPKKESFWDRILKAFGFKQSLLTQDVVATEAKPSLLARFIAMVKGLIEKALHVEPKPKPRSTDELKTNAKARVETDANQSSLQRSMSPDPDQSESSDKGTPKP